MAGLALLRCWLPIVVALLYADVTLSAYDKTVCDQNVFKQMAINSPGPGKPMLAGSYSVRVEANFVNDNRTVDVHEFYDYTNNRGAVIQWDRGEESRVIFDGNTDELITVTLPNVADPRQSFTRCEVRRLSTLNTSYVFGTTKYTNGTERIFNIGDTFRMAVSQPDVYLGTQLSDSGVWVEGWKSCVYMDSLNATFNATWFFTANNIWITSLGDGAPQSPVSLRITGRVDGAHAHDFDHVYSFSEYRPQFGDRARASLEFQTPAGVYCPGRSNVMPLPNMTDNFSFRTEVVDTGTQMINFMAEYYHFEMRIVRYEYQAIEGSVYGTNPLTRIHDFNTGVAYTIDRVRGNCSASPIRQLGFVAESQDSAFVVMRTAEQFFDLQRYTFVHTGQRTVRDIDCDVWITVRDDWPPKEPFETKWEWHFATRAWMESVGYKYDVQLPVMLRISAEGFDPPFERIFNIFDYRESQNNPWDFDISPCFSPQHRKEYTFTIPGNYSSWVAPDKSNFLFFFILAVTSHAQVSFTRVANVQVDYDANNIFASFSLLDQAPIAGDVNASVLVPQSELPLQEASINMEADIQAGTFKIDLQTAPGIITNLQVTRFTVNTLGPGFQQPPPPPPQQAARRHRRAVVAPVTSTYTAGALTGLAISMIVVGYGLGVTATLLAYRGYRARHRLETDNPLTELQNTSGPF